MSFENLGYLKIIQLMLKLLRNYDIIIIINNYVIAIHVYFFKPLFIFNKFQFIVIKIYSNKYKNSL
jgi:hypothetical protein